MSWYKLHSNKCLIIGALSRMYQLLSLGTQPVGSGFKRWLMQDKKGRLLLGGCPAYLARSLRYAAPTLPCTLLQYACVNDLEQLNRYTVN